jgi:hypothetical protein
MTIPGCLLQNFPNPFDQITNIRFEVTQTNHVVLKVYDVTGKEVATLVNEIKPAGIYTIQFDASNLNRGIYFYDLNTGLFSKSKKMVLVR